MVLMIYHQIFVKRTTFFKDMPYIYLTKEKDEKQIKLKIRVKETMEALRDLKEISSVYDDIEISEENIAFYENCNGEFNPPHVLHEEWTSTGTFFKYPDFEIHSYLALN